MKLLLLNNAGSGAAPGGSGSNTQVIFNDNGSLAGDSALTWNKTSDILTVTGDVNLSDGGTYTTTLQTITPTANRTISLPDATGTVALVAGSSGQLVYNNAGAYAGVSTMTFSGNNVTLAGRLINSYTSVADSPAKVFTGTWFTGGTATTTKPHLLIEPTGATSTAWSTSGTGLGVNAASTFAGNLLDLQVNGTSRVRMTSDGNIYMGGQSTGLQYYNNGLLLVANSTYSVYFEASRTRFAPTHEIAWAASGGTSYGIAADIGLVRSGTNTVKVTNGSTGDGTISGQLRAVGTAPATASSTGTAGDIRYDTGFIYVCTATNTWKRAALTTW
jgi:hypothetical protein